MLVAVQLKLSQSGRLDWKAYSVIPSLILFTNNWNTITMCTQCEGCEITHTESLPLPHTHCWTKHSTGLAGYVCLSFWMFACVYVWPSRVVMRDGVRLRRLKIPAFLWGVSFIYLPCPHAFILKHIPTDSVWQAQNHTQTHTPFVCVCALNWWLFMLGSVRMNPTFKVNVCVNNKWLKDFNVIYTGKTDKKIWWPVLIHVFWLVSDLLICHHVGL